MPVTYLVWLYAEGLLQFRPEFAEAVFPDPVHCWIAAGCVVVVLVTAISYRLVCTTGEPAAGVLVDLRNKSEPYFHERFEFLVLLAAAFLTQLVTYAFSLLASAPRFYLDDLGWFFVLPYSIFMVALIVAASMAAARRFLHPDQDRRRLIPPLPILRFLAAWLVTLVATVSGIGVLVWFSFALWLSSWI